MRNEDSRYYKLKDYPLEYAYQDLVSFFQVEIKDDNALKNILNYISKCKDSNILPMRSIHEMYMKHRRDYSDYSFPEATEMWNALMHFWG